MNTDHINYQQQLQQSVNDEQEYQQAPKNSKPVEQNSDIKNEAIFNGNHTIISSKDDMRNDETDTLTYQSRRERTTTLIVIGCISLLTGIDYAIILPTAWGYIKQYMQFHYGGVVMGLLLSVFALSGAIAGIILGYLTDKGYRLKRLVIISLLFKIVGNILYFLGINIYFIILSRLIAGIGMGVVPPLLAELSRRSTPKTRTQLLSKILACRQIGLLFGPCFTIILKQMNFKIGAKQVTMYNSPGLIMAILWFILEFITIFFFFDLPRATTSEFGDGTVNSTVAANHNDSTTVSSMLRKCYDICKKPAILVLLVASFVTYFNQTALETTLTPFTSYQFNWKELQVSILFAVAGIEITVVYIILHYASKRCADRTILLFGFVVLGIACTIAVIILPFTERGSTKLLPVFLLFVALDILALPLLAVTSTSIFTQLIRNENQGLGQGLQRFIINTATVIGPLYAGSLLVLKTPLTMLCIMLAIVVFATLLIIAVYNKFKPQHNQEEASALIRQSP
ncbi:unnamed protein product [Didymodactylos carnosus]|uniref:Major facilitator superfamily (MFS) profile domain-containing protein n=1 Tax=Didymodactylos carnosus TaxID=1234261 RepID=A0A814UPS9_9BILA